MNEISIQDLIHLSNPIIIDIRDKYTYNQGHLNNSKNIPYYSLLSNYSIYLNKQDTDLNNVFYAFYKNKKIYLIKYTDLKSV